MISNKLLLGSGFSYSKDYSNDKFADDNYYKSLAQNYSFNVYSQLFQSIENKVYYTPLLFFEIQNGKSTFRDKAPGFLEVVNTANTKTYTIQINPIQFACILKKRFLLQAGFGKIAYAFSKTKTDVPNSGDANGSGNGFAINFSPSISNIGISFIF